MMYRTLLLPIIAISCTGDPEHTIPDVDVPDTVASVTTEDSEHPVERSQTMERWAEEYAAGLGVEEHPGFLDLWSGYGGDIDGDGDIDSVGTFGMSSGGNSVEQYVAVFLNTESGLQFDAVFNNGWRPEIFVSIDSIVDGRIGGETSIWLEDDAQCCPSDSGRMALEWEPGILRAVE